MKDKIVNDKCRLRLCDFFVLVLFFRHLPALAFEVPFEPGLSSPNEVFVSVFGEEAIESHPVVLAMTFIAHEEQRLIPAIKIPKKVKVR